MLWAKTKKNDHRDSGAHFQRGFAAATEAGPADLHRPAARGGARNRPAPIGGGKIPGLLAGRPSPGGADGPITGAGSFNLAIEAARCCWGKCAGAEHVGDLRAARRRKTVISFGRPRGRRGGWIDWPDLMGRRRQAVFGSGSPVGLSGRAWDRETPDSMPMAVLVKVCGESIPRSKRHSWTKNRFPSFSGNQANNYGRWRALLGRAKGSIWRPGEPPT